MLPCVQPALHGLSDACGRVRMLRADQMPFRFSVQLASGYAADCDPGCLDHATYRGGDNAIMLHVHRVCM